MLIKICCFYFCFKGRSHSLSFRPACPHLFPSTWRHLRRSLRCVNIHALHTPAPPLCTRRLLLFHVIRWHLQQAMALGGRREGLCLIFVSFLIYYDFSVRSQPALLERIWRMAVIREGQTGAGADQGGGGGTNTYGPLRVCRFNGYPLSPFQSQ